MINALKTASGILLLRGLEPRIFARAPATAVRGRSTGRFASGGIEAIGLCTWSGVSM